MIKKWKIIKNNEGCKLLKKIIQNLTFFAFYGIIKEESTEEEEMTMKLWEEEYKKLNFWDKVRFHFRESQEERLESQKQGLENDDRQPIDRLKIAREIRLEREQKRLARQNRKNKIKALNSGKPVQYNEPEDKSQEWKVDIDPVQAAVEESLREEQRTLDYMIGKELNSKEDAYENIVELQRFLSFPHDHIPNVADIVSKKFEAISQLLGSDILEKGMEIAQMDQNLIKKQETMLFHDREKMQNEIINNPDLANYLKHLRYNPEEAKKQQIGEIVGYQAVYAKMIEEVVDKQNREQSQSVQSNDINAELRNQANSGRGER